MFNYDQSYPGVRQPVFARNVVATSHPLAAQAGLRVLRQGGNAVEAAVAAAAALTVCEPVSNGLGSDAFCILWDGKQLHGLNAAGRAPMGWTRGYFQKKYPDATAIPQRGIDSVTVPGAVAAWVQLNKRFGALSLAEGVRSGKIPAEQYINGFLKAGTSKPPLEILKDAGVDMTDIAPYKTFEKIFTEKLQQLKEVLL